MDPEIARNPNYDDHYADDSKDVHSAALTFNNDRARCARTSRLSPLLKQQHHSVVAGSVQRKPSKYKSGLSPTPVSPISPSSEEQKEHQDDNNEVHVFLQNIRQGFRFPTRRRGIAIRQPRFLLIREFPSAVMRPIRYFASPKLAASRMTQQSISFVRRRRPCCGIGFKADD